MKPPRRHGQGHMGVIEHYLDIFRVLGSKKAGCTLREVEKLVKERHDRYLTSHRCIQILEWMHEHDLAWRRLIGYRAHPHNYDAQLPIFLFGLSSEMTETYFERRVRDFWALNAKKAGRETKQWDATALLEAWA